MSHVQNDTRKIVKPKDITKGIARMMVLDLQTFDIVEGFNKLFKLVPNPFPNPDSFQNPDKFENLEIFGYPHTSTYYASYSTFSFSVLQSSPLSLCKLIN